MGKVGKDAKDLVRYLKNKADTEFNSAANLRHQADEHEASGRAYQDAAEAADSLVPLPPPAPEGEGG